MSVKDDSLTAETAIRKLFSRIEHGSNQELVDAGAALTEISHLVRRSTEAIKDRLRATAPFKSERTVRIQGGAHDAVVTVPDVTHRMAKGADEKALRRALGESFDVFFQTQITPRSEALPQILDLPVEVQGVVFSAIEQDFGAGSVAFIPRKP